jgi:hypothetical protein
VADNHYFTTVNNRQLSAVRIRVKPFHCVSSQIRWKESLVRPRKSAILATRDQKSSLRQSGGGRFGFREETVELF